MKPHQSKSVNTIESLSWERLSTPSDLLSLEAEWNSLHKISGGNLFNHFDWLSRGLKIFAYSGELHILCVRREGVLVACGVFNTEKMGVSKRVKQFKQKVSKHYQSLYDGFFQPLYADEEAMKSLVAFFLDQFQMNVVVMPLLREGPFQQEFVEQLEQTHRVWKKTRFECAEVTTRDGWEAYQETRSRNFSRSVGKSLRRFEKAGGKVEIHNQLDADMFARIEGICKKSWKHTSGTGIYAESQRRSFFTELCGKFSDTEELLILMLTVDGKDISFAIYVECNGVYHGVWSDFDEEFEKLSPGKIAIFSGLERAFATPRIKTVDMMRRTHFLRPFETNFYKVFTLKAAPRYSLSRLIISGEAFFAKKLSKVKPKKQGSVRRADIKKGQS